MLTTKKKFNLTDAILRMLSAIGEGTLSIIAESFLSPKYSFTKATRLLLGFDRSSKRPNRETISVILSRLKQQGLVKKVGSTKNAWWRLTPTGKKRLKGNAGITIQQLPKEDGKLRIVMFDIPEKERRKRRWSRTELSLCDYRLLQKSVWLGRRPLPQVFLEDAGGIGVTKYLHILEVSQKGTVVEI